MAYGGEGQHVALVVNGGTPTYYLGKLEEISGTTVTKYFTLGSAGLPLAERVGTNGVTYLASDGLGTGSLFVQHQPVPFTPLRCRSRS